MKKILLSLACMLAVSIAASAYNNSAVVLHHNGNMTTYDAEQINDAMDAAVDGDEVYLSEGTYPSFTIKSKIGVRGTGDKTFINGNIYINIPDTPVLTANLLEFLNITGTVSVEAPIKGMRIKQCIIKTMDFKANTYDSYMDRCNITTLDASRYYRETVTTNGQTYSYDSSVIKGLTVTNSVINSLHSCGVTGTDPNTTYINCWFKYVRAYCGTITNSIISGGADGWISKTLLVNTYCRQHMNLTECEVTNCYLGDSDLAYDADLASLGYYGNDGTIIGPLGGNTPYTLKPAVPHVTESSMKVDTEKQQLNVILTVSPK